MRSRIHTVVLPAEVGDFADEVRQIFLELGRTFGPDALAGECSPALDVYETDDGIEVVVDVPGVEAESVRVVIKGDSVLVAGEKIARRGRAESSFHLVERGFGRFARTVRFAHACDGSKARATLVNGELHISLPKITERRGQSITVPVQSAATPTRH